MTKRRGTLPPVGGDTLAAARKRARRDQRRKPKPSYAATIATPMGQVARCQAKSKASQQQCKRAANAGVSVCAMHGAGTKVRVQEGTRESPALAPLAQGVLTPRMLELYEKTDSEYAARIRHWKERRGELRDLDDLLARLRAAIDIVSESNPSISVTEFGEQPPPVVTALKTLADVFYKIAQIEWKQREAAGAVSPTELRTFARLVAEIIDEFVPPEQQHRAYARLERFQLDADARPPGAGAGPGPESPG